jgi:hypothetical protein
VPGKVERPGHDERNGPVGRPRGRESAPAAALRGRPGAARVTARVTAANAVPGRRASCPGQISAGDIPASATVRRLPRQLPSSGTPSRSWAGGEFGRDGRSASVTGHLLSKPLVSPRRDRVDHAYGRLILHGGPGRYGP